MDDIVRRLTDGVMQSMPADLPGPVLVRPHPVGGVQAVWRFRNDRGASVLHLDGVPGGLAHAAVVRFPGASNHHFDLDYSTGLIGRLPDSSGGPDALFALLRTIRDLPPIREETSDD